jgi:hypothetical protein
MAGLLERFTEDGVLLAFYFFHAFDRFGFRRYFLDLIFGQYFGFNDLDVGRVKRRSDASTAGVSPLP